MEKVINWFKRASYIINLVLPMIGLIFKSEKYGKNYLDTEKKQAIADFLVDETVEEGYYLYRSDKQIVLDILYLFKDKMKKNSLISVLDNGAIDLTKLSTYQRKVFNESEERSVYYDKLSNMLNNFKGSDLLVYVEKLLFNHVIDIDDTENFITEATNYQRKNNKKLLSALSNEDIIKIGEESSISINVNRLYNMVDKKL